ncbi:myosin head (motor domain) domain-containing protein [Besnoitia besnoiti]|uniref:Myosin head (Motor domain) domain-containing protein n=1 Tax=Besnoitia besnoiti TaxID=94643 RepID=A0A2A9M081_BESBE|nr:myosin head (motor domain) domain-containing protein [Besnoitia besnoiti]PFH32008.1 myosin head (motor domain) domain-containing protein [Besnoitia besnoiti]
METPPGGRRGRPLRPPAPPRDPFVSSASPISVPFPADPEHSSVVSAFAHEASVFGSEDRSETALPAPLRHDAPASLSVLHLRGQAPDHGVSRQSSSPPSLPRSALASSSSAAVSRACRLSSQLAASTANSSRLASLPSHFDLDLPLLSSSSSPASALDSRLFHSAAAHDFAPRLRLREKDQGGLPRAASGSPDTLGAKASQAQRPSARFASCTSHARSVFGTAQSRRSDVGGPSGAAPSTHPPSPVPTSTTPPPPSVPKPKRIFIGTAAPPTAGAGAGDGRGAVAAGNAAGTAGGRGSVDGTLTDGAGRLSVDTRRRGSETSRQMPALPEDVTGSGSQSEEEDFSGSEISSLSGDAGPSLWEEVDTSLLWRSTSFLRCGSRILLRPHEEKLPFALGGVGKLRNATGRLNKRQQRGGRGRGAKARVRRGRLGRHEARAKVEDPWEQLASAPPQERHRSAQIVDPNLLGRVLVQLVDSEKDPGAAGAGDGRYVDPCGFKPDAQARPDIVADARQEIVPIGMLPSGSAYDPENRMGDLLYLSSSTPAAIMDTLRRRFMRKEPFTKCGNLLISIFPPTNRERHLEAELSEDNMWRYYTAEIHELQPHPFFVARRALENVWLKRRNQFILTFGELRACQDDIQRQLVSYIYKFAPRVNPADREVKPEAAARALQEAEEQQKDLLAAVARVRTLLAITTQQEVVYGHCVDMVRFEFDADNCLMGVSIVPNTALEPSVELAACAGRRTYYPLPMANLFYALLSGVHHNPTHEILAQTQLHPVDAMFLLSRLPPQPVLPYEKIQATACLQFFDDLRAIGCTDEEIGDFTRLVAGALVADAAETWRRSEQEVASREGPRVTTPVPLVAGRDAVELLEQICVVPLGSLKRLYEEEAEWQVRNLALKLFARLRWWLVGQINEAFHKKDATRVPETIVLLASTGLDLRRLNPSWSLLQLIRNYIDECALNLFVTWGFSYEEELYKREGVQSPDVDYCQPLEILNVIGGPKGIFQKLKHLNGVFEGEFVVVPTNGGITSAFRLVDAVLNNVSDDGFFSVLPGFEEARVRAVRLETRMVAFDQREAEKQIAGMFVMRKPRGRQGDEDVKRRSVMNYSRKDPVLGQFVIRHTTGQVRYDARDFVSVNAAAFAFTRELRMTLTQSRLPLLRTILMVDSDAEEGLPLHTLRTDLASRFCELANAWLRADELDAPEAQFIATLNSVRPDIPSVALARNEDSVEDDIVARAASFTRSRTFIAAKRLRGSCITAALGDEFHSGAHGRDPLGIFNSDSSSSSSSQSTPGRLSRLRGRDRRLRKREPGADSSSSSDSDKEPTPSPLEEAAPADAQGRPALFRKFQGLQVPGFMDTYTTEFTWKETKPETVLELAGDTSIMSRLNEFGAKLAIHAQNLEEKQRVFDYLHVVSQLEDLQILKYCRFHHQGMTVRLTFYEFLRLYAVLFVPVVYSHQSVEELINARKPKDAVIYLLQSFEVPPSEYQLGHSLVFFRKRSFLILEMQRAASLRRVLPAVLVLQRAWPTFRARLFRTEMHWLAVRAQSQARRVIACARKRETDKVVSLLTGVALFGMHIYRFRRSNITEEQMANMEQKYRDREVFCIRWAGAVFIQSWWRSIMARKLAGKMRHELLLTFASQVIQNVWRRFKAQETLLEKIDLGITPTEAAKRIQAQVRRWICQRRYHRLRGLALALLSIRRKGSKLYSLRVQLNYTPIIKHTTVVRDMLNMQNEGAVLKLQSLFRMAYIRKQYLALRDAVVYCQAAAFTQIRRYEFLRAKKAVVIIQRWWRLRKMLLEASIDYALAPAAKLPKGSLPFLARREKTSVSLLRAPLLASQGFFDGFTQRSDRRFLSLLDFQAFRDIRNVYPQTWATPLLRLLEQIQAEANEIQDIHTSVEKGAAVNLEQIEIGGQHSLVLLQQRVRVDRQDFGQKVTCKGKGLYEEFAVFRPTVYAWGWNDRGQLGMPETTMRSNGLVCAGPLKFIDRGFRKYKDKKTGHLVHVLSHQVDYSYQVTWVGAGLDHCVAFVGDGLVFSWGDNRLGQCGLGHRIISAYEPQLIRSLKEQNIMAAHGSVGARHTAIVAGDGQCVIFGSGAFVALDTIPPDSNFYTPCRVPLPYDKPAMMVSCGFAFNIVMVSRASGVFGWGRNDRGQLGIGPDRKSVRDAPIFIPLPQTPGLPLIVEKIATGPDFVVVCVSPAKGCIYTWGAHLLTDVPKTESSAVAKAAAAFTNPFLKMQAKKAPATKTGGPAAKPPFKPWTKRRAVCEPTLVTHPLWRGRRITDAACGPREVAVLTELGVVYGFQTSKIEWIEEEKPEQQEQPAAQPFSFFFKVKAPSPKEEAAAKPYAPSAAFKPVKGKYTLEPALFSFRFARPARMVVKSLHSSYSNVSCSSFWATSVRRTRRVAEEQTAAASPEVLKEQFSCTGDPLQFPPAVLAKAQQEQKELQEAQLAGMHQPLPKLKDYVPWRSEAAWDHLSPDPRLLARMRAEYSKEAVKSPLYMVTDMNH